MGTPTEVQRQRWMAQWRSAAVALERIRADELVRADLNRIGSDLDDACVASARAHAASVTSGLVTQQQLFRRRHRA